MANSSSKSAPAVEAQDVTPEQDVAQANVEAVESAPSAPAAPLDSEAQGDVQGAGDEGASEAPEGDSAHVTASDIAKALGVQAKDLRRWLRASYRAAGAGDVLPGKGRRYAYTAQEAQAIVSAYGRASTIKGAHRAPGLAVARVFAQSAPVAPVEGEGAGA